MPLNEGRGDSASGDVSRLAANGSTADSSRPVEPTHHSRPNGSAATSKNCEESRARISSADDPNHGGSGPSIASWRGSNPVAASTRQSSIQNQSPKGDFERHYESFLQYGNFTMAFATLQPGMDYFESCGGYIASVSSMGKTFVLADPVGPLTQHAQMIGEFLKAHPGAIFCQVAESTAAILSERGWYINELGCDAELCLPTYDFEGPKKSKIRQAAHKIDREGYRVEERSSSHVNQSELEELSAKWIATKTIHHEARFLIRPFRMGVEPGVRKFFLFNRENEIVAFVVFDPICSNGQTIGYSPSVKRRSSDAPVGAEEAITKFAIERFREEQFQTLRLGLMPLYDVKKSEFGDAWIMRKIFQLLYRYGDHWFYSFKGDADFKHRYRGELSKTYLATPRGWGNALSLIPLMRACNLF